MESLGWRQRRGSSPAARRGARERAGLTPVSASNTLSSERETPHPKPNQKTPLTVITVSTANRGQRRILAVQKDWGLAAVATAVLGGDLTDKRFGLLGRHPGRPDAGGIHAVGSVGRFVGAAAAR